MKRLILAGAAALCLSNAVYAADLPVYEAPVAPVAAPFDWSGFYLGLQGGYGWAHADTSVTAGGPFSLSPEGDGFLGGAHVGYLHQFDVFVMGLEADVEFADIDASDSNAVIYGNGEINWMASVRLRAGYAWDRALLYATGGLAYGDFDGGGAPIGSPADTYSDDAWGWTVGAGLDYAFTDAVSFRTEYRFTHFDDIDGNLPTYGATASSDADLHAVRAGISYHF